MIAESYELPKSESLLVIIIQRHLSNEFLAWAHYLCLFFFSEIALCIVSSTFAFSPHMSLHFPLADLFRLRQIAPLKEFNGSNLV